MEKLEFITANILKKNCYIVKYGIIARCRTFIFFLIFFLFMNTLFRIFKSLFMNETDL